MKNRFILLIITFTTFIAASCKKVEKDPLAYYPKVKTISAVIQDDGSVIVTGEIEDEGTTAIEYGGFCMDTVSEPKMLSNQLISYFSGNIFTAVYTGFDLSKKYYFRAWAANEYGYAIGNVLSLDSIKATPVVPPCNLPANYAYLGGLTPIQNFYDVTAPSYGIDTWDITGMTGAGTFYFEFGSLPVTKIYSTTTSTTPGPNEVHVYFYSGFNSGTVSDGASFYVNEVTPGNYTMTMCQAPWNNTGTTQYVNMNFVCPL